MPADLPDWKTLGQSGHETVPTVAGYRRIKPLLPSGKTFKITPACGSLAEEETMSVPVEGRGAGNDEGAWQLSAWRFAFAKFAPRSCRQLPQ